MRGMASRSGRIIAVGKQILMDGEHLADCRDEAAAIAIATAIDYSGVEFGRIPMEDTTILIEFLCT